MGGFIRIHKLVVDTPKNIVNVTLKVGALPVGNHVRYIHKATSHGPHFDRF